MAGQHLMKAAGRDSKRAGGVAAMPVVLAQRGAQDLALAAGELLGEGSAGRRRDLGRRRLGRRGARARFVLTKEGEAGRTAALLVEGARVLERRARAGRVAAGGEEAGGVAPERRELFAVAERRERGGPTPSAA